MSNDAEFSLSEKTFRKILSIKMGSNFSDSTWDEWFDYIFSQNSDNSRQDVVEKAMEKFHNESFDEWIQNFAINLSYIWNESSARELDHTKSSVVGREEHSAIVIGRGPSIKKHNHLEMIANSNYNGSIICTDGALVNALRAGITPEKFPNFYVVTIDPHDVVKKFYEDQIVNKYGKYIQGIFSTVVKPSTVECARQAGIKINWLHALFDYEEGKKSFNKISALMVRAKNHTHGLPAIQTGGNVGTSSWFVGWQILKCSTVALIGINHGWNEDDPLDLIISHGGVGLSLDMDTDSITFKKLFPKIYNPEFDCNCILDPIFQFYSKAFKEFISRSPSWVNTVNATEGGSIFGDRIKCMTLKNFLQKYKN